MTKRTQQKKKKIELEDKVDSDISSVYSSLLSENDFSESSETATEIFDSSDDDEVKSSTGSHDNNNAENLSTQNSLPFTPVMDHIAIGTQPLSTLALTASPETLGDEQCTTKTNQNVKKSVQHDVQMDSLGLATQEPLNKVKSKPKNQVQEKEHHNNDDDAPPTKKQKATNKKPTLPLNRKNTRNSPNKKCVEDVEDSKSSSPDLELDIQKLKQPSTKINNEKDTDVEVEAIAIENDLKSKSLGHDSSSTKNNYVVSLQTTSNQTLNSTNSNDDVVLVTQPTPKGVKRKKRKVATQNSVKDASISPSPKNDQSNLQLSPKQSSTPSQIPPTNVNVETKKAPPPKKPKKQTFQNQVLSHLITSMKPFTLKSLASEMRTTDIALNHLMLSLVDKQVVRRKDFGGNGKRSKEMYWIDLDLAMKELYGNEIPSMDEINNSKKELGALHNFESSILKEMQDLNGKLTTEEVGRQLDEESKHVLELKNKLNAIHERISLKKEKKGPLLPSTGSNKFKRKQSSMDELTPNSLKKRINFMRDEWRKRKEKCMDFIGNVADAMEKKPKDVVKLMDIETDEAVKVSIPPKYVLS